MVAWTGKQPSTGCRMPVMPAVILLERVRVSRAPMCCLTLEKLGLTTSGNIIVPIFDKLCCVMIL